VVVGATVVVVGGTVVVVIGTVVVGAVTNGTTAAWATDVAWTRFDVDADDVVIRTSVTSATAATMQSTAAARTRRGSELDIELRRQAWSPARRPRWEVRRNFGSPSDADLRRPFYVGYGIRVLRNSPITAMARSDSGSRPVKAWNT